MHHIHGSHQQPLTVYAPVAPEKTAASQRAAEVRRALLRAASAGESDRDADPDAVEAAGDRHSGSGREQQQARQAGGRRIREQTASDGQVHVAEDETPEPISVWA